MGIFDFVRHGTAEMRLERAAGSPPTFVHPDASLPLYGQLEVAHDDCAVFVQAGRAVGVVGPGRHTVHPSKLAFLEGIAETVPGRLDVSLVFVRLVLVEGARFVAGVPLEAAGGSPTMLEAPPSATMLEGLLSVALVDPMAYVEDRLRDPHKPLLARVGVIASIDALHVDVGGVRSLVQVGAQLGGGRGSTQADSRARTEPKSIPVSRARLACASCGVEGESGTFCERCGAIVGDVRRCISCRASLEDGARFCASCGART